MMQGRPVECSGTGCKAEDIPQELNGWRMVPFVGPQDQRWLCGECAGKLPKVALRETMFGGIPPMTRQQATDLQVQLFGVTELTGVCQRIHEGLTGTGEALDHPRVLIAAMLLGRYQNWVPPAAGSARFDMAVHSLIAATLLELGGRP